jgi:hypothetical protein
MKNLITRSLVLILGLPLLGGCQTEKMLAKCPSTGILAEASSMSLFAPGKAMVPANLVYRIDLRRSTTSCSIDKDTHTADSELELSFRGYRQRGGGAAEYRVPFFVAINDSDGNLVFKKTYSADLVFQPGQTQVDFTQPLEDIAVRMIHSRQAFDYHLIVGFQLTPQQLDYNRKNSIYAQ